MHLALPMPKHKTLLEQRWPAAIAAALVVAGALIIPIHYPVSVYNGKITPDVVTPAEKVDVYWTQNWRELCPVTVTREFVGNDGFKATSASYLLQPPRQTGVSSYNGALVIPQLPAGKAFYRSTIEPHCWIDTVYQRRYKTPEVEVTVVRAAPAGPR